jgi:hypothetical protein
VGKKEGEKLGMWECGKKKTTVGKWEKKKVGRGEACFGDEILLLLCYIAWQSGNLL